MRSCASTCRREWTSRSSSRRSEEMVSALMGRKVGMTQVFSETGESIPVTVLEIGPNFVTQIKTPERDGYSAVQLGYKESKKLNKPERGHAKKAGTPSLKHLHEVAAD